MHSLKDSVPLATLAGQELTWAFLHLLIHSERADTVLTVLPAQSATERETDPVRVLTACCS